jgi:hypothetical protein
MSIGAGAFEGTEHMLMFMTIFGFSERNERNKHKSVMKQF